jgi:hypothetical protein
MTVIFETYNSHAKEELKVIEEILLDEGFVRYFSRYAREKP